MEDGTTENIKESKLKTTFAVFVMFVLMTAVAVVFLGIEMPSQESTQKKQRQQASDIESSIPKLTELVEELENQDSSFLEKTTTTINETQGEQQESEPNHFSEMNCNELADIASSFEDGWGRALAEFGARCEGSNEEDIEQQIISQAK